jgi:suppressor of ftsI
MQRLAALLIGVATATATLPQLPQVTPTRGITTLTLRAQERQGHAALSYLGAFVPPTIRVVPGGQLRVTYINDLAVHSTEQCALGPCMDMTNLHFHGMEVSPDYGQDDVITMVAKPGETLHYDVHIPNDVPPGL